MRLYRKFYHSLAILNSGGDWIYLIANLIKFYEGGITYRDTMRMTFNQLVKWNRMAQKINREIEEAHRKK